MVDWLKCFLADVVKYSEYTYYEYVEFIARTSIDSGIFMQRISV